MANEGEGASIHSGDPPSSALPALTYTAPTAPAASSTTLAAAAAAPAAAPTKRRRRHERRWERATPRSESRRLRAAQRVLWDVSRRANGAIFALLHQAIESEQLQLHLPRQRLRALQSEILERMHKRMHPDPRPPLSSCVSDAVDGSARSGAAAAHGGGAGGAPADAGGARADAGGAPADADGVLREPWASHLWDEQVPMRALLQRRRGRGTQYLIEFDAGGACWASLAKLRQQRCTRLVRDVLVPRKISKTDGKELRRSI